MSNLCCNAMLVRPQFNWLSGLSPSLRLFELVFCNFISWSSSGPDSCSTGIPTRWWAITILQGLVVVHLDIADLGRTLVYERAQQARRLNDDWSVIPVYTPNCKSTNVVQFYPATLNNKQEPWPEKRGQKRTRRIRHKSNSSSCLSSARLLLWRREVSYITTPSNLLCGFTHKSKTEIQKNHHHHLWATDWQRTRKRIGALLSSSSIIIIITSIVYYNRQITHSQLFASFSWDLS